MAPKRAQAASQGNGTAKRAKAPKEESLDIEDFGAEEVQQLRTNLLAWYDVNHRVLPWRRNPHSRLSDDALAAAAAAGAEPAPAELGEQEFIYYVWICEIMSQQTQVARAAEYFKRWVARWPTVQALAAASQEEVNELWAGLGYYRRARYLLDGAKYIVGERGGLFPTTAPELQTIPGVGAYTSAAIASIACGQRSAVVDGNVIRVLARLRRVGADPRSGAATKLWADLAECLLDPDRPGCFNQAMMELGATVCVPNTEPKCGECPIAVACLARRAVERHAAGGGDAAAAGAPRCSDYPAKVEKADKREESVAVAVVQLVPPGASAGSADLAASRFLLVQRPPSGLLAGLWQFPLVPLSSSAGGGQSGGGEGGGPRPQQQQQAAVDAYLEAQLGARLVPAADAAPGRLAVLERRALGELVHVFSHIRMTMKVEKLVLQGELDTSARGADDARGAAALQWLPAAELGAKGLSSGVKKVWKLWSDDKAKGGKKQSITAFFKPAPKAAAGSTSSS